MKKMIQPDVTLLAASELVGWIRPLMLLVLVTFAAGK
jgi:hypothetical protein